jgi:hypothetical protein
MGQTESPDSGVCLVALAETLFTSPDPQDAIESTRPTIDTRRH